jgi:hypothetical protein
LTGFITLSHLKWRTVIIQTFDHLLRNRIYTDWDSLSSEPTHEQSGAYISH